MVTCTDESFNEAETTPQQGQLVFGRRSKKRVSQLFKKLSKGSKSFGSRD
jgi:hypothetical protein